MGEWMMARPAPPRRSSQYAWLITYPLALFALICIIAFWVRYPDWYRGWYFGLIALVFLSVSYIGVFNVVIRRQNLSVVVTEIPLVLALYYLSPVVVILTSALATLVAQIYQRIAPTKLWFNVAKAAAATSTALLVIEPFRPIDDAGPRTWGVLFAAVMASAVVGPAAFAGVMSIIQGRHVGQEALTAGSPSLVTAAINTVIGL